jgi:hypothetical protein
MKAYSRPELCLLDQCVQKSTDFEFLGHRTIRNWQIEKRNSTLIAELPLIAEPELRRLLGRQQGDKHSNALARKTFDVVF